MGTEWYKTDFKGVRYRKHPERKNGIKFDQYFVITYKLDGKTKSEAVGWASEGFKASEAFELLSQLKKYQKTGKGPRTLAEMRKQGDLEREQAQRYAEAQAKLAISFKSFFDDTFFPDAETRWAAETARKAGEHVKNWIDPVTGTTPMREIGLTHAKKIRAAMAKNNSSPRHQQYVFRTFSMVWDAARDHGLVNGPCPTKSPSFRLPKVDNERQRYLTFDEEKTLFAEILKKSKRVHDMAVVSLDAGLRFGEIAGLTWGCVDLAHHRIQVMNTKGKKDRIVPMTTRLQNIFNAMDAGQPKELAFPTRAGTKQLQIPSSFTRAVADAKLNAGIEDQKMRASFHTLRHTYASRLVQSGVDLYRVQRLLGHSTPVMTSRYSKLADDDLKQAVEKMEERGRLQQEKKKGTKVIPLKRVK